MTVSAKDWPDSPLDAVDAAFATLTCEPEPLSLDLDELPDPLGDDTGLPGGVIALPALQRWLLEHPRAYTVRDAVWRELIRRARLDGPAWVIAATALAMPALRRYAGKLRTGWAGDAYDLDAEILTGFLTALRDRVDLARPAPYAALCKAAWRAGHELRRRNGAEAIPVDDLEHVTGPRTPKRPYGHPDLLVRRAVELGIVDACDEQPYIDLRLGRRAVEPIAARLGIAVDTLRQRVKRIDERIADALAEGVLTEVTSPRTRDELARKARQRQHIRAGRNAQLGAAAPVREALAAA
jgi:DNA-directed RNA polymerase specialized sigma24 family protein